MAQCKPLIYAILEDARPSYGVFASYMNCLESPPALSREDRKKTTSSVSCLLPDYFRPIPSARRVTSLQRPANASEIPALDMKWRQLSNLSWRKMQPVADSAHGSTRTFRDTCRVEMHSRRTV